MKLLWSSTVLLGSLVLLGCRDAQAEQRAVEAKRQAALVEQENRRFCEEQEAYWRTKPGYNSKVGVEGCLSALGGIASQNERQARIDRAGSAQKEKEIEALREASCEIDPTSEHC